MLDAFQNTVKFRLFIKYALITSTHFWNQLRSEVGQNKYVDPPLQLLFLRWYLPDQKNCVENCFTNTVRKKMWNSYTGGILFVHFTTFKTKITQLALKKQVRQIKLLVFLQIHIRCCLSIFNTIHDRSAFYLGTGHDITHSTI